MTIEIQLTERGPPELVPLSVWRQAYLEEPMRILAARGVVRLSRTPVGVLVTPGHHVGEMILSAAVVRIGPKSADLFDAMKVLALSAQEKTARHFQGGSRGTDGADSDPAGEFSKALLTTIREGIPWKYGVRTSGTSFPRGRIQFGRTVRQLASRGIKHRVVASVPIHVQVRDFVRVVQAAIGCLPGVPGVNRKTLAEVELLASSLDRAEAFLTLEEALQAAHKLVEEIDPLVSPGASTLAVRSAEIIAREYAVTAIVEQVPGGVARFQDLEELWERCTQYLVACWLRRFTVSATSMLHGLRGSGIRLFDDGGPRLDPDVLVRYGRRIAAVFDAKYKMLEYGSASSAADLYQMTAYVRRLGAGAGVLVYLASEREQAVLVGMTPEGAPVVVVSISPELLLLERENSLTRLLDNFPSLGERLKQRIADSSCHERRDGVPNLTGDIFLRAPEYEVIREGL